MKICSQNRNWLTRALLLISTLGLLGFLLSPMTAYAEAELGEDGLHKAEWMVETFRDLAEDHAEAEGAGKNLMILWEQRGCIYCDKMHKEVFTNPEIEALLRDEFHVVQYNLFGDVEVTDFDGDVKSERDMAMKWGVMFTPTIMIFPLTIEEGAGGEKATAPDLAAANMPGAFGKWTTLNLLKWVREEGYLEEENFQKYHARKIEEARNSGALVEE